MLTDLPRFVQGYASIIRKTMKSYKKSVSGGEYQYAGHCEIIGSLFNCNLIFVSIYHTSSDAIIEFAGDFEIKAVEFIMTSASGDWPLDEEEHLH